MNKATLEAKEKRVEADIKKLESHEVKEEELILFSWSDEKIDPYNISVKIKSFSVGTGEYKEKDGRGNLVLEDATQYIHDNSAKFKMWHSQKERALSILEKIIIKPDKVFKASPGLHKELKNAVNSRGSNSDKMKEYLEKVRIHVAVCYHGV